MRSHSIKAVVFDLGKVLVDFDYDIAKQRILKGSSQSQDEVMASLEGSEVLIRYEKGQMTSEEFFQAVRKRSGFTGSYEDFGAAFGDIFAPMDSMIELFRSVKSGGFKTIIFSNTNELAIRHIGASFDFYGEFDGHILSYEQGFMKPEAELYEAVEQMSRCKGPEIVYIDDRIENIEAGRARNWNVVLQTSPESTRTAFANFKLI